MAATPLMAKSIFMYILQRYFLEAITGGVKTVQMCARVRVRSVWDKMTRKCTTC